MSRINDVAKIYDLKCAALRDPQVWESTLKRVSNFWRLSFVEAMLLTEQKPKATMCATIDQWNKVGRFIKRGERSAAVFKHRTDTQLMYLFDIDQTYGKAFGAKWKMSESIADGLVGLFNDKNGENYVSLEDFLQKSLDKRLSSEYNYSSKLIPGGTAMAFIRESAECICFTRCGIEKSYNFGNAAAFAGDLPIVEIGNTAVEIAQGVLQPIEQAVRRKEYELYQAGNGGRHLRYPIRGGQERTAEPELRELRQSADDPARAESGRSDERVRPDGSGYDQYERTLSDDLEGDRGESGERSPERGTEFDENNNSEQELQRASGAEGGNSDGSGRGSVGIAENERELAVGGSAEAEDADEDRRDSSEYLELNVPVDYSENSEETVSGETDAVSFSEKSEKLDPNSDYAQELLKKEIINGSGFVNGKFRIEDYIRKEAPSNKELVKFLKDIYGIGGGSRNDPVAFANHDSKGLELKLNDGRTVNYSWSMVAKAIKQAVTENVYITDNDRAARSRTAVHDAERFTIHYEFPCCIENVRLAHIRSELQACGIDLEIKLNGRMFAVYASEAIRNYANVREAFKWTDHSGTALISGRDYSAAVAYADKLTGAEYEAFVAACRSAVAEVIERISEKEKGFPTMGFTDEEINNFFSGNEALSDNTIRDVAAKLYGYLCFDERFNSARETVVSREEPDDEQLTLFDEAGHDVAPEIENTVVEPEIAAENTEKENELRHDVAETENSINKPLANDYSFPADFAYPNGPKAKYSANIAAIKTLKRIEAEHRYATAEEQEILARYSGWGGVADAFDDTKDNWSREYAELKDMLTSQEYAAARESTLTAFYTEPYIIKSIYKALDSFGFKGGYVLDPSMGTGNFFGCMPREMAESSRLFGVELDSITARIAKKLYPNADIRNSGFERVKFENGTFDVIVGNVPFGEFAPYDNDYEDYLIHDYFFAKSVDKLKPGGVMALITSSGTMDKQDSGMRGELYRKADFVGEIRLPNDAFKTAGTQIVTDILFFRKLEKERDYDKQSADSQWVRADYGFTDNTAYLENKYFTAHSEMVLGKNEIVSGRFGNEHTVKSDGSTAKKLNEAVSKLKCSFSAEPTIEEMPEAEENADIPDGIKPYTYYVADNKLYYAENRTKTAVSGKNNERIIGMCGILDHLDKIVDAQKAGCTDAQLKELQAELNDAYDLFVAKYGYLNTDNNVSAFRDDVRAPRLHSIENVI